ncbi:unnamed protein product [Prorocentrum cordatum]|uniref:RRM domain-containing protein n=1 Tax=Prorocentrum cordatum TaxID=2364126 RepID=A0ABN9V8K4_9DINO|nr:unnamed protein product [Polarella glacialis]
MFAGSVFVVPQQSANASRACQRIESLPTFWEPRPQLSRPMAYNKVFIGQLARGVPQKDLRARLADCGAADGIEEIHIAREQRNFPGRRAVAFVCYESAEQAAAAVALTGSWWPTVPIFRASRERLENVFSAR